MSNIVFGLTVIVVTMLYLGLPNIILIKIIALYMAIYVLVFMPLYASLPLFFLRRARKTLARVEKKERVEEEKVQRAVKEFVDFPGKLTVFIFVSVWGGFSIGALALGMGIIPEVSSFAVVLVIACVVMGFAVSIVHAFLNYVLMETYLRRAVEFLTGEYPEVSGQVQTRPFPLFFKILLLVLLTNIATFVSIWILFSTEIGLESIAELGRASRYTGIIAGVTFVYIYIITLFFSRSILYPLLRVIDWSKEVAGGKRKKKMSVVTNDEIMEMVKFLRLMVEELDMIQKVLEVRVRARTKELKELNEKQEEIIEARTKDLKKKIKDLESFRRVVVGREMKMMELKKKIKKLEAKIEEENKK